MFKSRLIGWITATTLLCVAGVAIACRLQEGSGRLTDGLPVASADTDTKPPTVPEAEATPVESVPPPPAAEAPPLPTTQAVDLPPPPPPVAAVPVMVEKVEKQEDKVATEPTPKPPVESSALPPPRPQVGESVSEPVRVALPEAPSTPPKADIDPAATAVAPPSEPIPVKKVIASPATPAPTPPVSQKKGEPRNYWAEQGDTLREIARKRLGNEDRWMEIEKLNPELRARTLVPAGTLVRLPGTAETAATPPMGEQVEAEFNGPETRSNVKPLPVIRAKPEFGKSVTPLIGTFECRVDEKLGLVLPKEVCERLGRCETLYLTPGPDRCLWLVSESGEARVRQRVEKAAIDDDEVLAFRRLYYSQTRKVGVDMSSRLSVPASLSEYAGIGGNVVIIGADDHYEIWDAARWQRYSQEKGSTPKTPRGTDE